MELPPPCDVMAEGVPAPLDTVGTTKSAARAVTGLPSLSRGVIVQSAVAPAAICVADVLRAYKQVSVDADVGLENTVITVLAATPVDARGTVMVNWPEVGRTAGLTSVN